MGRHACFDRRRRKGHAQALKVGLEEEKPCQGAFDGVSGLEVARACYSEAKGRFHLRVSNERPRSLAAPHQGFDRVRRARPWVFWTSEKGHAPLYLAVPARGGQRAEIRIYTIQEQRLGSNSVEVVQPLCAQGGSLHCQAGRSTGSRVGTRK
jgi:hypothetical protein